MEAQRKIRVRFKKPAPAPVAKADAEHWITLHPNGKEAKGTPALINGAGQIIGGAGGKLTGKVVNPTSKSEPKPGTEKQHAPAIWLGPAKAEEPGKGGEVSAQPPAEPPPVEAPKPPETETPAEKPKQEGGDDPELTKMESDLAKAKDILEKASGYPEFMRKEMEAEIARKQAEIDAHKAKKQGGDISPRTGKPRFQPAPPQAPVEQPTPPATPPEHPPAVPPETPPVQAPKPTATPEPEPEPEKPAEAAPEIAPEKPGAATSKSEQIGRDADKLAENVKTFDDAEAAYKKYREANDWVFQEKLQNTEMAKELHQKMMDARSLMSQKSFEFSDNAKTIEDHRRGVEIHRKLYDLNKYTTMRNAHAVAHNTHLKAIKKEETAKAKAEKKAAKAEEKRTGNISKETKLAERFAKSSPDEIRKVFQEKYGIDFTSKPDTNKLMDERAALNKQMFHSDITQEQRSELFKREQELRSQIVAAERYARVRGFTPTDASAKTASGKNARMMMAHVEDTLDELTSSGYDIQEVMRQSKVAFASGTLRKYGGMSWQVGDVRYTTVDANKYFKAGWTEQLEGKEQERLARGDGRWNAGSTVRNTIIHELAHSIGISAARKSPERLSGILEKMIPNYTERQNWINKNISEYGTKNIKETDAELASMVLDPKYKRGTLPKELEDHVDWLFMKKGV